MSARNWTRDRGGPRALPALALALAIVAVPAACGDLVDPEAGFEYHVELVAPDSVPLGAEVVAVLHIFNAAGQRVRGPTVTWSLERPHNARVTPFLTEPGADPDELRLRARGGGEAYLTAVAEGRPGRAERVAMKSVHGIAQGVRIAGAEGEPREIVLLLGDETTVHGHLRDIHGVFLPEAGEVDFDIEGDAVTRDWEAPPLGGVQLRAWHPGTGRIIATARSCAGACQDTVQVRVIQVPGNVEILSEVHFGYLTQWVGLHALVTDTRGEPIYGAQVQWSLGSPADTLVITLAGDVITAQGNGEATVIATFGELADTTTVTVWQYIERLHLDGPSDVRELTQGARDTIQVTPFDPDNHVVVRPFTLTAASGNPAVVSVAVLGDRVELTTGEPGSAVVLIHGEGAAAQLQVEVNPTVD